MATQTFEVETYSIDEARKTATLQLAARLDILSQEIIQSNNPVSLRASGQDSSAAYAKARADVPEGAS